MKKWWITLSDGQKDENPWVNALRTKGCPIMKRSTLIYPLDNTECPILVQIGWKGEFFYIQKYYTQISSSFSTLPQNTQKNIQIRFPLLTHTYNFPFPFSLKYTKTKKNTHTDIKNQSSLISSHFLCLRINRRWWTGSRPMTPDHVKVAQQRPTLVVISLFLHHNSLQIWMVKTTLPPTNITNDQLLPSQANRHCLPQNTVQSANANLSNLLPLFYLFLHCYLTGVGC